MRLERDKMPWLAPGDPLQYADNLPMRFTKAAQWWVTAGLTLLDDTKTPAFRRLPFACTLACLAQIPRAVEDWLHGWDGRGERLVSELQDLMQAVETDECLRDLMPHTAQQIGKLGKEVLEFLSIRALAPETRGSRQRRFMEIICNEWKCRAEDGRTVEENAVRVGPGVLAQLARELLLAIKDRDDYRYAVQNALVECLSSDGDYSGVLRCGVRYLRMMQVLGHSTSWLQLRIEAFSKALASTDPSEMKDIMAKSFPRVLQSNSRYVGVVALEPMNTAPDELPEWMSVKDVEQVQHLVSNIGDVGFRALAQRDFCGATSVSSDRKFFEVKHCEILGVSPTPWGRYTDQFDAATDISAAVVSTLQNYWAGNPRRDLRMQPLVLVYMPDTSFYSVVSLEWQQKAAEFPVTGLYELAPGLETAIHWVYQSSEAQAPEVSFLCAWIAGEKLVARTELQMASGRRSPHAIMIDTLLPVILLEEVRSRLHELRSATYDLIGRQFASLDDVLHCLLDTTQATELADNCSCVPRLSDEIVGLAQDLADPARARAWLDERGNQIRRNFHRMCRLRNQIVHNAELDRSAAAFLAQLLADYVRIGAYRVAAAARNKGCGLDEAFGYYRQAWREVRGKLDSASTLELPDFWRSVVHVS